MPIRIYSKQAKNLTLSEEKECSRLVTTGAIYSLYVECCHPEKTIRNRVYIAKYKNKCVGWSIIKEDKKPGVKNNFEFMVFIKRQYRRNGIATKMYKRSKKYFKLKDRDIKVFSTDTANTSFFNTVRKL